MTDEDLKDSIERGEARPVSKAFLMREEQLRQEFINRGYRAPRERQKLIYDIHARARAQAREEELSLAGTIMIFASPRTRRQYIEKMLEVRGHTVYAAVELRDCLKRLGEHRVDLMMVNLEGLDSLDMTRRLKSASASLRELPFVLLSDRTSIHDVIEANTLNIVSWFVRPYRANELVDNICERVHEIKSNRTPSRVVAPTNYVSPVVVRTRR